MYSDPCCIYIPSYSWPWKILIFSLLWSGLCEESHLCFVLCVPPPPQGKERVRTHSSLHNSSSDWREVGVGVLFRPWGWERGWKTKMALLWPNGHPIKSFQDFLSGEHTSSVKKNMKTKQEQCVLYFPHSSSERWGCGLALGLWDLWLVV